jgi:hypothetical protein
MTTRPPLTPAELAEECFRQMTVNNMEAVILDAIQTAIRQERARCVGEMRELVANLEQSAAAPWPDDDYAAERTGFDDGLLTAAGRLRCRASVLEKDAL